MAVIFVEESEVQYEREREVFGRDLGRRRRKARDKKGKPEILSGERYQSKWLIGLALTPPTPPALGCVCSTRPGFTYCYIVG